MASCSELVFDEVRDVLDSDSDGNPVQYGEWLGHKQLERYKVHPTNVAQSSQVPRKKVEALIYLRLQTVQTVGDFS